MCLQAISDIALIIWSNGSATMSLVLAADQPTNFAIASYTGARFFHNQVTPAVCAAIWTRDYSKPLHVEEIASKHFELIAAGS
ncbi:hypothetical protein Y882_15745 [Dyella japonica DSM 16301]|uniref:Uncharacterized protein n=1 Tax=Dyella japonica DSM 16301 TaxID=1440762 RepID=A0A0G9GYU6_9GAMM|nr:hypothetical protein Y882_15745 [Dyella japonica DSM 16301]